MFNKVTVSVINTLFKILFSFLILVIGSKYLSIEELNYLLVLVSIIGISQVFQMGFNVTFLRYLAYSDSGIPIQYFRKLNLSTFQTKKTRSDKQFYAIHITSKYVYLILALLLFVVLILLGSLVVKKPLQLIVEQRESLYSWYILLLTTPVCLYLNVYRVYLEGTQRLEIFQITSFGFYFISSLFLGYCYYFGVSILELILLMQFAQLATLITIYLIIRLEVRELSKIQVIKNYKIKRYFKLVWINSRKSGFTQVVAVASKYSSGLIAAQFLDAKSSAAVLFTFKIFDVLEAIVATVFAAKSPELTSYRGIGNLKKYRVVLLKTEQLGFLFYVLGYFGVLSVLPMLLNIVGSKLSLLSPLLIVFISIGYLNNRLVGMQLAVSNHANHVIEHIAAIYYFCAFYGCLFLSVYMFGVYGIVLSLLFASTLNMIVFLPKTYKTIGTNFASFEKFSFVPALLIVCLINVVFMFCTYW